MSSVPTVRVKSFDPGHPAGGFVLMNADAFDPEVHELYEDQPAPESKAATEQPTRGRRAATKE